MPSIRLLSRMKSTNETFPVVLPYGALLYVRSVLGVQTHHVAVWRRSGIGSASPPRVGVAQAERRWPAMPKPQQPNGTPDKKPPAVARKHM
jgi:hypothetical protein